MQKEAILQKVEHLTFAQRFRYLVETGRLALTDPALASVLEELEQGDWYERFLALQSCFGSRKSSFVLRTLTDLSRLLRKHAIRLVSLICSPEQISEALHIVSFELRLPLIRALRKEKLQEPIDVFLATLAQRNDPYLGSLLSYASPTFVQSVLNQALPRFRSADWRRLARHHPDITLSILRDRVEHISIDNRFLAQQINSVLPTLALNRPDETVTLITLLAPTMQLSQLELQPLIDKRPNAMLDLLLAARVPFHFQLKDIIHKLTFDRILILVQLEHPTMRKNCGTWFRRLPPEQRLTLYTLYLHHWRNKYGLLECPLVIALPREQREMEGRLYQELPLFIDGHNDDWCATGRGAVLLPWQEAVANLERLLHHPEPYMRGLSFRIMGLLLRYQREHLDDLLVIFLSHKNEADPARRGLFFGLYRIPVSLWQTRHLEILALLIRASLDAVDLSHWIINDMMQFLVSLIPHHPEWSAQQLALIMREQGVFPLDDIDEKLSETDVRSIAPVIQPVLESWEAKEHIPALLAVATGVGKRLRVFDELVTILERVIWRIRDREKADALLALFVRWQPERAERLITRLVQHDTNWFLLPSVASFVHRWRQDLLTPVLTQRMVQGHFSAEETRFFLPLKKDFWRWTRQQQRLFAQAQEEVLLDEEYSYPLRLKAMKSLFALPAVVSPLLFKLAQSDNPRKRSRVLQALAHLDGDEGFPVMIEALKDERAPLALSAFASRLLQLHERQAFAILQTLSLEHRRIASGKIYLLGQLHLEEAYQELLHLAALDQPPDLQAAILQALWRHLDRPETWEVLTRAANEPHSTIVSTIGHLSIERLTQDELRRVLALINTLLDHPDPEVRIDLLQSCRDLPVSDHEQLLTPRLLQLARSPIPAEYDAALFFFQNIFTERDIPLARQFFEELIPDRKKLQEACTDLDGLYNRSWLLASSTQPHHLALTLAVLELLATDPLTISLRIRLACSALTPEELAAFLEQLAEINELHAEAIMRVCREIEEDRYSSILGDLEQLEQALRNHPDERLRRIAFSALIAQSSTWHGGAWTEERLARLQDYRADLSPLVAGAAQFTFAPASSTS